MPRGHGGGFHGIAWGFDSPRSAASGPRCPGSPVRGRGDAVTCCARHLPCAFTPPGAHSGPPLCSFCAEVTPCHVAPRVLGEAGLCSQGTRCFWGELPSSAPPAATVPAGRRAAALTPPMCKPGGNSSRDTPVASVWVTRLPWGVWFLGAGSCSSCVGAVAVGTAVTLRPFPPPPRTLVGVGGTRRRAPAGRGKTGLGTQAESPPPPSQLRARCRLPVTSLCSGHPVPDPPIAPEGCGAPTAASRHPPPRPPAVGPGTLFLFFFPVGPGIPSGRQHKMALSVRASAGAASRLPLGSGPGEARGGRDGGGCCPAALGGAQRLWKGEGRLRQHPPPPGSSVPRGGER